MILEEIKEEIIHIKESKEDLRKFGYTVGGVLIFLALILIVIGVASSYYFGFVGIFLVLTAFIIPSMLKYPNKMWMTTSIVLGWIMTRVILIVLFYFVVTFVGLLAKIFKKDFLDLKLKGEKKTYWQKRKNSSFDTGDYERQF